MRIKTNCSRPCARWPAGGNFFAPKILKFLIDDFAKPAFEPERPAQPHLTKRETEILRYIAEGLTSKEIAHKLFLSARTVDTHRANLMQKLNLHETAGLVRYAIQNGIVDIKACLHLHQADETQPNGNHQRIETTQRMKESFY